MRSVDGRPRTTRTTTAAPSTTSAPSTPATLSATTTTSAAATTSATTATTPQTQTPASNARVVGQAQHGASVWPAALDSDVALLGESARQQLTRLFVVVGNDAVVKAAVVDALADPSLWCVPMRTSDEQRVLAAAMGAVPLSSSKAKQPSPPIARIDAVDAVTDGKTAIAGAFGKIEAAWAGGADVVIAPEWLFVPENGPPQQVAHDVKGRDALVAQLAALTAGSDRLLVPGTIPWVDDDGGYHNTAYAFSDGKVAFDVDKRGDGDDVDIAKVAGFDFVSRPSSSTFSWRGVTVGLEVCRDHGDARLRYELLGKPRDVVDLHLVVSSGVWLKHPAVGVGGAIVVAQGDGIAGHERARRGDDGKLEF